MKLLNLKRKSTQKVAVLATGLVAALLDSTVGPPPAQAFPSRAQNCTNCHGSGSVSGTVTATPSAATQAPGAAYTVVITMPAGSGDTGYWIANSDAAGVTGTSVKSGGAAGTAATSYTVAMTAPATAGTHYYKAWGVTGAADASGITNFALFSITVAAAPVAVTTTTALAVSPASAVAPASPTLTATVTGAGAAGSVQFLNGTTVLGTSQVATVAPPWR